jgi:hypothetical protein
MVVADIAMIRLRVDMCAMEDSLGTTKHALQGTGTTSEHRMSTTGAESQGGCRVAAGASEGAGCVFATLDPQSANRPRWLP